MATILTPQQEQYIDFVASGQIDVEGRKISYEEFASAINIDRTTLYKWQKSIPEFWPKVARRASELIDRKVPKIIQAMYIKALRGDVAAAKLLLNQGGYLKTAPENNLSGFSIDDLFGFDPTPSEGSGKQATETKL